jgi:hypothetical protein
MGAQYNINISKCQAIQNFHKRQNAFNKQVISLTLNYL